MAGLGDPWDLAEESETGRYVTVRTKDGGRTVARIPQSIRKDRAGAILKAPQMRKLMKQFANAEPDETVMKYWQDIFKRCLDEVDTEY